VSNAPDFTFWLGIEAEDQIVSDLTSQSGPPSDDRCASIVVRPSYADPLDDNEAGRYPAGT